MDEVLKGQILIDKIAKAIAEGNEEQALRYFEEYKILYEKITGKKLQMTFESLKRTRIKK